MVFCTYDRGLDQSWAKLVGSGVGHSMGNDEVVQKLSLPSTPPSYFPKIDHSGGKPWFESVLT